MPNLDDLWKLYADSKQEAQKYYKNCEYFCKHLADLIEKELHCEMQCSHQVEINKEKKEQILIMEIPISREKNIYIRFHVKSDGNDFAVAIEGHTEEFKIPETNATKENFTPLLDFTYKWLQDVTVACAWKI